MTPRTLPHAQSPVRAATAATLAVHIALASAAIAAIAIGAIAIGTAAPAGQDEPERERLTELSPDGRFRIEREVRREGEHLVNDGEWRRSYVRGEGEDPAPAEDLPAAEGRWSDGLLEGPWIWRYRDGTPRMTGSYALGRRTDEWQLYHPTGASAGGGRCSLGLRNGHWDDRLPDGSRDERYAGAYTLADRAYWPGRERRWLADTRKGARHGSFTAFWRDGRTPMLAGRYLDGRPSAWWSLWLVDGTPDPELVTGWYQDGERIAAEPLPRGRDAWDAPLEERLQLEGEAARLARGLPAPARYGTGITARGRAELQGRLEQHLAGAEDQLGPLRDAGRPVVSDVLQALRGLDLSDPGDVARGALASSLLRSICAGRGFAWRSSTDGEAQAANRLAQARWLSWWELVRDDDDWWSRLEREELGEGDALLTLELLTTFPGSAPARPPERVARVPEPAAPRRSPAASALVAAQDWLLAHQEEGGGWSSAGFAGRCDPEEAPPCDGPGLATHDVGVSGLALLALMADGRTAGVLEIEEAVSRGLAWLVSRQRPTSDERTGGLIGEAVGHAFLYDHAIATLALAEGYRFLEREDLREPLERAVALVLRARNPASAWRYEVPPNQDNDTSVTGWMVAALVSAERAGLGLERAAIEGALSFLDAMTEPETGRVGYDTRGGSSARVPDINMSYPTDRTECMTAVGLLSRLRAGQVPEPGGILEQHAELLLRALPEWHPEGLTNDMYYWYHGTCALRALEADSPRYWEPWSEALQGALLGSQRAGGHAQGSFDPNGPWGYAGGRVYSTALTALALEKLLDPPR